MARRILQSVKMNGWQIGKTCVFLRAGQLAQLEGARGRRLTAAACIIQSAYRGMAARRLLRNSLSAIVLIQVLNTSIP